MAYDMAAIEYRGLNAVTNFGLSRYIKWLRPNQETVGNSSMINTNKGTISNALPTSTEAATTPSRGGSSASSALGLLLQSSKLKEMLDRASTDDQDCSVTPLGSDLPRRSFPADIQTYFDCQDDSIFADLNSLASPIFHCELVDN